MGNEQKNDIVIQGQTGRITTTANKSATDSGRVLDMIEAAMIGGMEPEKLEHFIGLYERVCERQAMQAFYKAKQKFQSECPPIPRTKMGPFGPFAPLGEIGATIAPLLKKTGLSYRWDETIVNECVVTTCYVRHEAGFEEASVFSAPVEKQMHDAETGKKKGANAMQRKAGAGTFGKRQSLVAALGIVSADTDSDGSADGEHSITAKETVAEGCCPIGKQKGMPWSQVDLGFCKWVVDNITDKPDVVAAAKKELANRGETQIDPVEKVEKDLHDAQQPDPENRAPKNLPESMRALNKCTTAEEIEALWALIPATYYVKLKGFKDQRLSEVRKQ